MLDPEPFFSSNRAARIQVQPNPGPCFVAPLVSPTLSSQSQRGSCARQSFPTCVLLIVRIHARIQPVIPSTVDSSLISITPCSFNVIQDRPLFVSATTPTPPYLITLHPLPQKIQQPHHPGKATHTNHQPHPVRICPHQFDQSTPSAAVPSRPAVTSIPASNRHDNCQIRVTVVRACLQPLFEFATYLHRRDRLDHVDTTWGASNRQKSVSQASNLVQAAIPPLCAQRFACCIIACCLLRVSGISLSLAKPLITL